MTSAQSTPEALRCGVPVRRFEQYENAVQAVTDYETALCRNASRQRSLGLTVADQGQPEEAFCLFPARPALPPLAIIGGMGPLAGALAFRRACARFRNSRVMVLYQACSIPDRSTVILSEKIPDSGLHRDLAAQLARAVRLAAGLAGQSRESVRCLLACNSAHYFWNPVQQDLEDEAPGRRCEVQMVSLVHATLDALKIQRACKVLLLTTVGARVGQVFSAPLHGAGIPFEEPGPTTERLLMRTIFEGMKSLDERRAVELGNEFFESVLRSEPDFDCLVAGCTEIPLTIDLLRLRGSPEVAAFISRIRMVDPLEEALRRT